MGASLAEAVLSGADEIAVARRVERLRERSPSRSRDELAEILIRRTALQCAAVGALTGAPAAWLGAAPVSADLPFQVVALSRLALGIAMVYRRRPDLGDRGLGAAGSLVLSAGAGRPRSGALRRLRPPPGPPRPP